MAESEADSEADVPAGELASKTHSSRREGKPSAKEQLVKEALGSRLTRPIDSDNVVVAPPGVCPYLCTGLEPSALMIPNPSSCYDVLAPREVGKRSQASNSATTST